jgi:hypothetical protein
MLAPREVTGAVAPASSVILGICADSHLDFMNTWQSMSLLCRHRQEASHSVQSVTMHRRKQTGGAPLRALTVTENNLRPWSDLRHRGMISRRYSKKKKNDPNPLPSPATSSNPSRQLSHQLKYTRKWTSIRYYLIFTALPWISLLKHLNKKGKSIERKG